MDLRHCMGQVQRDIVIIKTLADIPVKAAGIGQDLIYSLNMRTFQGKTAGHNETDITGTQNYGLFPHGKIIKICIILRDACGKYSTGPLTWNGQCAPCPLPCIP